MVVLCRSLTSPEPVPPWIVLVAPAPYRAMGIAGFKGRRVSSFFSKTMPSRAALPERAAWRCSYSAGAGFVVPGRKFSFGGICMGEVPFLGVFGRLDVQYGTDNGNGIRITWVRWRTFGSSDAIRYAISVTKLIIPFSPSLNILTGNHDALSIVQPKHLYHYTIF